MLIGSYSGRLSPKRRTAIPKKFLAELGEKIIIARWYEGCLVLVGTRTWEALLSRITPEEGIITAPVRDTNRFILASAYELFPDPQGRVIIPPSLVAYAHLGESLVFLGLGDRVEVWNREEWAERERYVSLHAGKFIEEIAKDDKR
jgi:MraZ protein